MEYQYHASRSTVDADCPTALPSADGHRVLVLADNEVARQGVSGMLRSLHSVAQVTSLVSAGMAGPPDVHFEVLIVACDDIDAADPCRWAVEARRRGAKVLLLLNRRAGEDLDTVARIPSNGYLLQDDVTEATLGQALNRVVAGEVPMPASLAHRLLDHMREVSSHTALATRLTPRERETLVLLAEGLSNKQIARRMLISHHGVKRLVANILIKLNCANRTLAVTMAIRHGLVEQFSPMPAVSDDHRVAVAVANNLVR